MKILGRTRNWLTAALLFTSSALAFAQAQPGKDYLVINPPQPTESGNKIEVLEVFSYMCPHCSHFEPTLAGWAKKLPADVQFRRMPVVFGRASWETLARTYYSLEALGAVEKVHSKIFDAIHEENLILQNKDTLAEWMGKQGVDQKKFSELLGSFGVQSKIQRSNQRAQNYGISGVPSLVIDGKYMVSTTQAGSEEGMLKVTDQLIQMIRAMKAVQGTAPSKAKPKPIAQK